MKDKAKEHLRYHEYPDNLLGNKDRKRMSEIMADFTAEELLEFMLWYKKVVPIGTMRSSAEIVKDYLISDK